MLQLSPEDRDLTERIRQAQEEAKKEAEEEAKKRAEEARKKRDGRTTAELSEHLILRDKLREKVRALLKPRLGGREPEKVIRICQLQNGTEYHTHYATEAGPVTDPGLPSPAVLPPHFTELFTGGAVEPCLQHTIELSIGVTGTYVSQKKTLPYEVLQQPVKNQQELERLVVAATQDYRLVNREMQTPLYMTERRRKISAVLFDNAELYMSEFSRQQVAQLLQQIDNAISLYAEGKAGEEEVRTIVARLREKPGTKAQAAAAAEQPLEQKAEEYYLAEMYAVPARLQNPEEVNLILRIVKVPYEVVLDAPPGFGMFRFTKPGYSVDDKMITEATEVIPRLDKLIGMLRGTKTKEQLRQELPPVAQQAYEAMKQQPPT